MRASSSTDPRPTLARLADAERATLLAIARTAIAARLGRCPARAAAPTGHPGLDAPGAAFVTLKLAGASPHDPERLRGCIGSLEAHDPLWQTVATCAERAALEDPRFAPISADELDRVTIHVSVLGPHRRVTSPAEIRLGVDGVILEHGAHRGVFLPQVAVEQRWDVDQLLENLARKAGLAANAFRTAELQAFETETFGEAPSGTRPYLDGG